MIGAFLLAPLKPSATGAVVVRTLTRYEGNKTIEALQCLPPNHFSPIWPRGAVFIP